MFDLANDTRELALILHGPDIGNEAACSTRRSAICLPPGELADQDLCLATMVEEIARQIEADGVLVSWHDDIEPVELFLDRTDRPDAAMRSDMRALAKRAASSFRLPQGAALLTAAGRSGQMLAATIQTAGGLFTVTGLFRSFGSTLLPRCKKAFGRTLPLVSPFFQLWAARKGLSRQISGLTAALDNSGVATLLTSRSSEVRFMNRAARELVAAGMGLEARHGILTASTLKETLRLQAGIEHVCANHPGEEAVAPVLAIKRGRARPLMVTLSAAPATPEATDRQAIVCVFDPEQDLARLIDPVCSVYGLSSREADLASRLATGVPLASAAEELGLSEHTARSYLKQIFLKTETNRQAELVGLLLKSAVRTTPRSRMCVL